MTLKTTAPAGKLVARDIETDPGFMLLYYVLSLKALSSSLTSVSHLPVFHS
jgi:hypothetical protein